VHRPTLDIDAEGRPLGTAATRLAGAATLLGLLAIGGSVALGPQVGWSIFFRSYLLNYSYFLSLALGALFFVMLQHVVRAGWSVSVRRVAEMIAGTLPWLAVLFLPLLVPVLRRWPDVYPWTDPGTVQSDPRLAAKAAYLNVPFFVIRCAVYFAVWSWLALAGLRESLRQDDTGDVRHTQRAERRSAAGLVLFGLTVTFFAVDLLMSLHPHWYSTIWGVYFFSGSAVGFYALLIVLLVALRRAGRLTHAVSSEHFHDLGKFAFGFVVFWAYIAFSQYLLIWYANLPEETVWYRPRQGDRWWIGVSLLLLVGHFVVPLLALMSRYPKRRPHLLVVAAVWLLAMHWLDMYYIVKPRPWLEAGASAPLHATDALLLVGIGGLFVAAIVRRMARWSLLPRRDPRLVESLSYENV